MGLLTVFYSPETLFEEVGRTGKWLLPFLAAMLVAAVITVLTVNSIDMSVAVREQLESNPRVVQALGQEKIDQIARDANSPRQKTISSVSAPVVAAIVNLIVAGILLGLMMVFDAGTSYKKVLSVCAYCGFAYGLVAGAGGLIVLKMMGDTGGVDMYNLIKLNPTLFLDRATTSKALYSMAGSLDLLSFWRIFLTGLGLSKVSPKLGLAKGLAIVIIPWAVYVLGKMGWAAIF